MREAIITLTQAQTRTQEDISNLTKVVSGLVDIVVNGRNGQTR